MSFISEMTNLMQIIEALQLTVTSNNESIASLDAKVDSNDADIEENAAKILSNTKNITSNMGNIASLDLEVDNFLNLLNDTADDVSVISEV